MIFKSNLKYFKSLADDHELLVVSFFVTNPNALKKLKLQWGQRDREHKSFFGRTKEQNKKVSSSTFGGSICLIDPDNLNMGILGEVECPVASGMYFDDKNQSLCVGSNKKIKVIKRGKSIETISNNLFNDLHSFSPSKSGNLLVTSTGVDAILEININTKKIIWDWLATENGYSKTPSGQNRIIDRNKHFDLISTTTPEHATHLNSCLEYKENRILATLFHQGSLIEIDKKTKKHKVLLQNLKCPHNIRSCCRGFIISDTRNDRVLLLNNKFKITKEIIGDFDWVQDAVELKNSQIIVGDSNNERIVKFTRSGKPLEVLQLEKGSKKIFSFLLLIKAKVENIF